MVRQRFVRRSRRLTIIFIGAERRYGGRSALSSTGCRSPLVLQYDLYLLIVTSQSVPSKVAISYHDHKVRELTSHCEDCLAKNSYKEEKCKAQIDALYECCNSFYQKNGDHAQTASCPKATLLRLKIKQRAQESEI
jgi:hypothetical protein